jgi:hypothetical protein
MTSPKKINYTKWGFLLGTPAALIGTLATIAAVPEIRCNIGLFSDSCIVPKQEIDLVTQTETGASLPNVKIQFIAKGPPEIQYTDANGYAKVKIPSKGDVRVSLSATNYPVQDLTINLATDQNVVRIIRFNQSGQPDIQAVSSVPLPSITPSPSSSLSPEASASTSPTTNNLPTTLLQTDCQSATPGVSLDRLLRKVDNFSLTLGREVVPLLASIGLASIGDLSASISRSQPLEFVCNLQSGYKQLKLVYGIHGGNRYALPNKKIIYSVFLDGKLASTQPKLIVVGSKQAWNLNVENVKNIAFRAECATEICPSLSFTEMTLR